MLIETDAGSILCDPWFEPAFFGGWFPFPRNDQLSDELRERIDNADFLYVSHLHGDHHDKAWLDQHLRRDIPFFFPAFRHASSGEHSPSTGSPTSCRPSTPKNSKLLQA